MEDLLIKSYNAAQAATIPIDAVNAVLSGGEKNADAAAAAEHGEGVEEEASSTTTPPENVVADNNNDDDDVEVKYNVGDYVRCTYTDGIDYEATIIKINYTKKTCRIRYIGYENEETVKWDALVATWGEEARNAQYEKAKAETAETADTTEVSSKKKTKKTPFGFNPPPVPPIPPMLFDSEDEEKNQQFAQLLISWFMTGYYTGLHQRTMQSSKK